MKKLLSMFLLGLFGVVSFASADTVDWFTSDNDICTITLSNTEYLSSSEFNTDCIEMYNYDIYFCIDTVNTPYSIYEENFSDFAYRVNSNPFCWQLKYADSYYDFFTYSLEEYSEDDYNPLNWVLYYSETPITPPSSSSWWWSEWWSIINWTNIWSWVHSGVNAFLSWFWWLIPLFLMLWLPILFITLFWNWIRSYIKHFFVWWDLPTWDHITNCNLVEKNWEFVHEYRDWRWQFIETHSVPEVDSFTEFSKKAEAYADEKLRNDPDFYSLWTEESMERWWKYKMEYTNKYWK